VCGTLLQFGYIGLDHMRALPGVGAELNARTLACIRF